MSNNLRQIETAQLDMLDKFPQSDSRNKKDKTINRYYQEIEVEERFSDDTIHHQR